MTEPAWVEHAIWWQIYPLGFVGAFPADPAPDVSEHRLRRVSEWLDHPVTGPLLRKSAGGDLTEGGASVLDMVGSMPMRRLLRFPGVDISPTQVKLLLGAANNPVVRGVAGLVGRKKG